MLVRGLDPSRPAALVRCAACGASEPPSEWSSDPWLCSPCRAEHTGTVQISSRRAVADTEGGRDIPAIEETRGRLAEWASALESAAASLREMRDGLDGAAPEEVVARACMYGLESRPPRLYCDSFQTFSVSGLPPEVARRLSETTRAEGPWMTESQIRESLCGRETP